LSLWRWPSTSSIPFKAVISGKIYCNNFVFSNSKKPIDGVLLSRILFHSVTIRSLVIILIQSQLSEIA